MNPRVEMPRLVLQRIDRRRGVRHQDIGKQLRVKAVEVFRPVLVVVGAHWQADRTIRMLCEVGEAAASVDDVAVVAEMILTSFGSALVRNRVGRTELPARATGVAELGDTGVDRMVDCERNRCRDAAHAEERSEPGIDDGAVPTELAEAGLQPDRDMQQVAVADRMLYLAGVADRSQIRRELDD